MVLTEAYNFKKNGIKPDIDNINQIYFSLKSTPPSTIDIKNFKLINIIGLGGFGIVFKAYSKVQNKHVALKFLDPETTANEDSYKRVIREINNAQKIKDERIVSIYSIENWKGIIYLVMEFYEGETLNDYLAEKKIYNWQEFKPIFLDILRGVKVLHDHKIIHRDLKLSNIFIKKDQKIVLLDFGLSKKLDEKDLTVTSDKLLGTIAYMSPEQLNPKYKTDNRSDIYQMGLILYMVLFGKLPFEGNTTDIMVKKLYNRPEFPLIANQKLPKYLKFGIQRALEKNAINRFKSISEMINYFEKEHYPFLGSTVQKIKKKPIKTSILFLLLIVFFTTIFIFIKNSKTLSDVKHYNTRLMAYNPFGFKIWEKDFTPNQISRSYKTDISLNGNNYSYTNFLTDSIAEVFIKNQKLTVFSPQKSIIDESDDNQYIMLNSEGKLISKISFSKIFFGSDSFGFSKRFYITRSETRDINGDGNLETMMLIRHAATMYPSAFVYKTGHSFRSFRNPGAIGKHKYIINRDNRRVFLLYGYNNLLSHLGFIAEVNLANKNVYSIPNYQADPSFNISSFLVFLPKNLIIEDFGWNKMGEIKFLDSQTNDHIIVSRNYKLMVKNNSGEKIYTDNELSLQEAYIFINSSFKEKNKFYNLNNAYKSIKKAIDIDIENPYLLSAIYHMKGDIEVSLGDYSEGQKSLNQSLAFYRYNTDAVQRLSEINFLKGKFSSAIQYVKNNQGSGNKFWGLSNGEGLFIFYCKLSMGDYLKAKEFYEGKLNSDIEKNNSETIIFTILKSIYKIFLGEYNNAVKLLKSIEKGHFNLFTIAEYRLFYARAILLDYLHNQRDDLNNLKKAYFYFKDLNINTYDHNHFCKISQLYLDLIINKGDFNKTQLELALKTSYDSLLKKSKGDFFTRFWLFYDSYIYGKCMERLNNINESIRGYNGCLNANPHTDLAKKSSKRIKYLSKQINKKNS